MKKLLLIFLLIPALAFAASPSRTKTYIVGQTINPSDVTENEDNIYNYLSRGVDTFASGAITNDDIMAGAGITYSKLALTGGIVNADISSSAAITDSKLATISTAGKVSASAITGGVALPTGAVFYMLTGSCPSGTTDVTATYTDKFIRINATQGTLSGSDTHTHTFNYTLGNLAGGTDVYGPSSQTTPAGSNVPAFVTCKLCRVD